MFITLLLSLALSFAAYIYMQKSWSELKKEQELSIEKARSIDDLATSLNQVFFRSRGYYAFQIENELNLTYQEMSHVHKAIERLRTLELNSEERELIDEMEEFLLNFESTVLPYALSLVENSDYKALRELSLGGSNDTINRLIAYSKQYEKRVTDKADAASLKTMKQSKLFSFILFLFGAVLLTLVTVTTWRFISNFITPIEKMKLAADKYHKGIDFTFNPIERTDEIGALSNSFSKMITTIQAKTEEMMAQNEELLMQQDELYKNQTIMENALSDARFAKLRLERYNGLNHKLSFTLDKQELVNSALEYFDSVYSIDIGAFWLFESDEFAIKGITRKDFYEFKEKQANYIKIRLEKEPYFTVKREAIYDKGISTSVNYAYDYYAAVKNNNSQFSTAIAISRVGRPFSKEDMHDISGLLNRVALIVDRIEQYEHSNHERLLNKNVIDNVNEGIQFVSINGAIDRKNHAFKVMLDLDDEFNNIADDDSKWIDYLSNKVTDPANLKQFFTDAINSEVSGTLQNSYTIPGESPRVIDVYSVPIVIEDAKVGTIFVHRDITQEHEIDRMKTELVSTVSHELRTPLSSILGFTELLLSRQLDASRQKRYLETIQKEAKRLTNLINDFLDLQQMEHGNQIYNMTEISLLDIAKNMVESFKISNLHSINIVDHTNNTLVKADADKIAQVFTNLLSNALKFSPDGGPIMIGLSKNPSYIIVSIRDEGIGIPEGHSAKMFDKFQRFDSGYSSKIGGTGLGLAICKEIIERHEGEIWIETAVGKGTTVYFSLPLNDKTRR